MALIIIALLVELAKKNLLKSPTFIEDVDVENVLVCNKNSSGEKKL